MELCGNYFVYEISTHFTSIKIVLVLFCEWIFCNKLMNQKCFCEGNYCFMLYTTQTIIFFPLMMDSCLYLQNKIKQPKGFIAGLAHIFLWLFNYVNNFRFLTLSKTLHSVWYPVNKTKYYPTGSLSWHRQQEWQFKKLYQLLVKTAHSKLLQNFKRP